MRRLLTVRPVAFDLRRAYRLNPAATLRPEPFGALAYHSGNRRLSFLKSRPLVSVVRLLESHDSAAVALEAAGVPVQQWERYAGVRLDKRAARRLAGRPAAVFVPSGRMAVRAAT